MTVLRVLVMTCFGLFVGSATPAALAADETAPRIMLYGDSILAGYGLPAETAFAGVLARRLADDGFKAEIVNASVSGDTTAGGVSRLDWALADKPDLIVLALGGNDVLRGIDPANTRANLTAMLSTMQARGIPVLLAGMQAPRNLGPDYVRAFDPIYPDLAVTYHATFYPFLLDGIATDPAMNQADGIHPNPKGVQRMVDGLAPLIERMLNRPAHRP